MAWRVYPQTPENIKVCKEWVKKVGTYLHLEDREPRDGQCSTDFAEYLLARPLTRIIYWWRSPSNGHRHGLSPWALAAITKHSPKLVMHRALTPGLEGLGNMFRCGVVQLPVIGLSAAARDEYIGPGRTTNILTSSYPTLQALQNIHFNRNGVFKDSLPVADRTLQRLFELFGERNWRTITVDFDPMKTGKAGLTPEQVEAAKFANTLGLPATAVSQRQPALNPNLNGFEFLRA